MPVVKPALKPLVTELRDPEAWNALVSSLPHSSALQGWGWGEVKRHSGWTPYRLRLEVDGVLIAAAQVLRRKQGPLGILYCPRGPALRSLEDLEMIALALRSWAGPGDVSLKIEPPVPILSDGTGAGIPESLGVWQHVESTQPEHTVLLDLTKPEADFMKSMHERAEGTKDPKGSSGHSSR